MLLLFFIARPLGSRLVCARFMREPERICAFVGDFMLGELAQRAPVMKTVSLPRGRHRLHTMPTSTGYEIRTDSSYSWDGRKRGQTPFTVLQHTVAGCGKLRYDRRHLLRKLFEAMSFNSLSRWATPRLERAGLRHPDRMFGLHQTGHVAEDYVLSVLAELPEGVSEIYCHPALIDDEARRWRPTDYESEQELAALTSPRVREAIDAAGIELITYRDL